jgi:hypothetical protein
MTGKKIILPLKNLTVTKAVINIDMIHLLSLKVHINIFTTSNEKSI